MQCCWIEKQAIKMTSGPTFQDIMMESMHTTVEASKINKDCQTTNQIEEDLNVSEEEGDSLEDKSCIDNWKRKLADFPCLKVVKECRAKLGLMYQYLT